MPGNSKSHNDALITILSIAYVAGMVVALVLFQIWRKYPEAMAQGIPYHAAVALCPPFILVGSVGGIADSTLALVLTAGSMVIGNGALYAGMAAFAFWGVSTFGPKRQGR